MKDEPKAPGPLTLEEAEQWLHWLEDQATIARDSAFATQYVLGNLLRRLNETGQLDAKAFTAELLAGCKQIEQTNERRAAESFLSDLLQGLAGADNEPTKH